VTTFAMAASTVDLVSMKQLINVAIILVSLSCLCLYICLTLDSRSSSG
jgi:hypothetical protein